MKKKSYLALSFFVMMIALVAGVAYYLYSQQINDALGIGTGQIDAFSESAPLDAPTDSSALSLAPPSVSSAPSPTSPSKEISTPVDSALASAVAPSSAQTDAPENSLDDDTAPNTVPTEIDTTTPASADNSGTSLAASLSPSSPPAIVSSSCAFPAAAPASTTHNLIFNEIAWMGSPSSSTAEWMEIKNNSSATVNLAGWEILNASGKIKIYFSSDSAIAARGFFLLARASAGTAVPQQMYTGDLVNTGDVLALIDPQCAIADYVDASAGWPGGNNTTKATLERDADGVGWHTSTLPGGTPGAENSSGPAPVEEKLTVAFQGPASGANIVSDPAGLVCGATCTGSFPSGTFVTLMPTAGANAVFSQWEGACSGAATCAFTITANTSLSAEFSLAPVLATPQNNATAESGGAMDATVQDLSSAGDADATDVDAALGIAAPPPEAVLIAAVQIGGAASSNDFVKIYNPTASAIDMSGWKLHKKSDTGADYSLKDFPVGSVIAPGTYFVWANAEDGFSATLGADVSSTETLAANNSVALLDTSGTIVDAVAWGTGTDQYGEGPPYSTNPAAGQVLTRSLSSGEMVNTENNNNDFTLQ